MAILAAQPHLQHMLHALVLGEMHTEDITKRVGAEAKRSVPAIMNSFPDPLLIEIREPCKHDGRIS